MPNCFLCFMYSIVTSRAPSAIPRACEAIPIRPPSRVCIATLNPLPSPPRSLSLGMRQFWKISSVVEEAQIPILSSVLPIENPGSFFSTMNALIPWLPFDLSVIAITTNTSAYPPFVMKHLAPFSTHSSPSSSALVCCPDASVPAFGSVRPKAPSFLPDSSSGRYFIF